MRRWLRQLERILLDRLSGPVQSRLRDRDARQVADVLIRIPLRGAGIHINGSLTLIGAASASIGDDVHVGDGTYIRADGGLVIGGNTHINQKVTICTVNHEYERNETFERLRGAEMGHWYPARRGTEFVAT